LRGSIPSFIHISNGKLHDVHALDMIVPEAGAIYVMDRGYVDFARLYGLHEAGAFFVTRADGHHNTPSLRWKISQCSTITAVDTGGHCSTDRARGSHAEGCASIRSLSASVSMLSMASPHGASVIPRPMTAIPCRFAAHGQAKLHQD
jgi:hypothetical protein